MGSMAKCRTAKSLANYHRCLWWVGMSEEKRGVGRPKGKRSNPNYIYVGGYISRDTYRAMKHLLIDRDLEISELLQQLIDGWIYDSYLDKDK